MKKADEGITCEFTSARTKKNYSFLRGCNKVSREDYPKIQQELKEYLGCATMQYYYHKRKNYPDMPVHVKEDIEAIFSKYGVNKPDDIWEITEILK